MLSCHCWMSCCRSLCSCRNSDAALSSSICFACVSVASSAIWFLRSTCSFVSVSMRSMSSLMRDSSARVYFCSARLSSSFCFSAMDHCSSSSWFQFMRSLNSSRRSLALKISFCAVFSCSCVVWMLFSTRVPSLRHLPASRSASSRMCTSVSFSFTLAATSPFVCCTSCCTLEVCSFITLTRSTFSMISWSSVISSFWLRLISRSSALASSEAKSGRSSTPGMISSSKSCSASSGSLDSGPIS
mmetsp:Transcript_34739/g.109092  ORF Transcript_34739/g.109092 Transcript_34739/m.109092 type:complete len:243 (-) Transcript_34739:139-867(-)